MFIFLVNSAPTKGLSVLVTPATEPVSHSPYKFLESTQDENIRIRRNRIKNFTSSLPAPVLHSIEKTNVFLFSNSLDLTKNNAEMPRITANTDLKINESDLYSQSYKANLSDLDYLEPEREKSTFYSDVDEFEGKHSDNPVGENKNKTFYTDISALHLQK